MVLQSHCIAAERMHRPVCSNIAPHFRYLFLNALANHLRYPNNHTHYFSCVVLHLFVESKGPQEQTIQEQITRYWLLLLPCLTGTIVLVLQRGTVLLSSMEVTISPRIQFSFTNTILCSGFLSQNTDGQNPCGRGAFSLRVLCGAAMRHQCLLFRRESK